MAARRLGGAVSPGGLILSMRVSAKVAPSRRANDTRCRGRPALWPQLEGPCANSESDLAFDPAAQVGVAASPSQRTPLRGERQSREASAVRAVAVTSLLGLLRLRPRKPASHSPTHRRVPPIFQLAQEMTHWQPGSLPAAAPAGSSKGRSASLIASNDGRKCGSCVTRVCACACV